MKQKLGSEMWLCTKKVLTPSQRLFKNYTNCHNGFPLDLNDHENKNGVATDLFCTGVIGHPGHVFLN